MSAPIIPLARRQLQSITAQAEKRLLTAMARRLPDRIGPDHLTLLGGLGMAGAGLCYGLVPVSSLALLGANLFLLLNWYGDSLDGTLARVRDRQRPRYGFYVDHLLDGAGSALFMAGLGCSGLIRPSLAAIGLACYLLFQLHIALKAHATGVFQIAFGGFGGTELRILIGTANCVLWFLREAGRPPSTGWLEIAFVAGLSVLLTTLARDAFVTGRALDREERGLWPAATDRPRQDPAASSHRGGRRHLSMHERAFPSR